MEGYPHSQSVVLLQSDCICLSSKVMMNEQRPWKQHKRLGLATGQRQWRFFFWHGSADMSDATHCCYFDCKFVTIFCIECFVINDVKVLVFYADHNFFVF
ncbi:hypothetical protein U9M48_005281, partial [Paspalum notatum var. saurae]